MQGWWLCCSISWRHIQPWWTFSWLCLAAATSSRWERVAIEISFLEIPRNRLGKLFVPLEKTCSVVILCFAEMQFRNSRRKRTKTTIAHSGCPPSCERHLVDWLEIRNANAMVDTQIYCAFGIAPRWACPRPCPCPCPNQYWWAVLRIRIRDRVLFWPLYPGGNTIRIRDPRSGIGDKHSGSYFRALCNFFLGYNTQVLCQFSVGDLDMVSGIRCLLNPGPGMENPDPVLTSRIRNTAGEISLFKFQMHGTFIATPLPVDRTLPWRKKFIILD